MARPFRRRSVMFVSRAYSHDPHERIDTIGGMNSDRSRWKLTQAAANSVRLRTRTVMSDPARP